MHHRARPLSEPMLSCCRWRQISVNLMKIRLYLLTKMTLKMLSALCWPTCFRLSVSPGQTELFWMNEIYAAAAFHTQIAKFMGPTWVLSAPNGPHVGPTDLALMASSVSTRHAHITDLANCTWWRHQMEIFSALVAVCSGYSPVAGAFPAHKSVTRSFDVSFDLHGWAKTHEASDLSRHRANYDVGVMR